MSTKSTKNAVCSGNCSKNYVCFDMSPVVVNGKCRGLPLRTCPLKFFEWLKGLGKVTRIADYYSEFYEHYVFYVGGLEIDAIMPNWVTYEMLYRLFGCPVDFVWG